MFPEVLSLIRLYVTGSAADAIEREEHGYGS
jgi:hypothetical protein